MAAQARAALENAVTDYKRCTVLIKRCLDATPVNRRSLASKMKSLAESLNNLNVVHTAWVTKAGLDDTQLEEDKYSPTWLQTEWGNVDDIQIQVDELLEDNLPVERSHAEKLQICTNQMDTLKIDIETKISNLLSKSSTSNLNAASLKLYGEMLDSVSTCLATEFTGLSKDIMSLDHANVVTRCQQFEEFRRTQLNNIDTVRFQLAEKTTTASNSSSFSPAVKSVEMEKSKAPSFSSKTID